MNKQDFNDNIKSLIREAEKVREKLPNAVSQELIRYLRKTLTCNHHLTATRYGNCVSYSCKRCLHSTAPLPA